MKVFIREAGFSGMESRAALHYSLKHDVPVVSSRPKDLVNMQETLKEGLALPIGSVEFLREAFKVAGITEPENMSYPGCLQEFLKRDISKMTLEEALTLSKKEDVFIKPARTKLFTGKVFGKEELPQEMHPLLDEEVWVSTPVRWQAECRYYIIDHELAGWGRYDDGPDEWREPDLEVVQSAIKAMKDLDEVSTFSIDMGVLENGETALVECNDAWALGLYKGTLSETRYVEMLMKRWGEIVSSSRQKPEQKRGLAAPY